MKRLVLLGCLITLIGCARQKTDAEYWMLKGRVAEMRGGGAIAYLKFGKWVPDTINRYDEIHTFDHSGRWMESRFFEKESYDEPNYVVQRSPGDSSVRIEYGYNREGDLKSISSIERINRTHTVKKTSRISSNYKKDTIPLCETDITYSDSLTTITRTFFDRNQPIPVLTMLFLKDGCITRELTYIVDGDTLTNQSYQYIDFDEQGNWLRRLVYDSLQASYDHDQRMEFRRYKYYD